LPGVMGLSTMLLRSMHQARYSEDNYDHFGFATENYTHFTSPIRSYPDLFVHRLIREMAQPSPKTIEYWAVNIHEIALQSSTSQIRRYPDLSVHRLLREMAQPSLKTIEYWAEKIPEIAQQSSNRERRAVDAEREVEKMKKAEFMEKHVGEQFEGVIASVTRFG